MQSANDCARSVEENRLAVAWDQKMQNSRIKGVSVAEPLIYLGVDWRIRIGFLRGTDPTVN